MKVTLTKHGVLVVQSESAIEAYALRHWKGEATIHVNDLVTCESSFIRGSRDI